MKLVVIYQRVACTIGLTEEMWVKEEQALRTMLKEHGVQTNRCLVIRDTGSGATRDQPGLLRLRRLVKQGRVAVLAMRDFSRLGRHADVAQEAAGFVSAGVRVFCNGQEICKRRMLQQQRHMMTMLSDGVARACGGRIRRGLEGAARRGTAIGRPPFGIKAVPAVDGQGHPMVNHLGERLRKWVADPQLVPVLRLLAERFVRDRRSCAAMAQEFNEKRIGGSGVWTPARVMSVLRNPIYSGVSVFGRTQVHRDPANGQVIRRPTPQEQWIITPSPETKVWSASLGRLIQRRLLGWRKVEVRPPRLPNSIIAGQNQALKCSSQTQLPPPGHSTPSDIKASPVVSVPTDAQAAGRRVVLFLRGRRNQLASQERMLRRHLDHLGVAHSDAIVLGRVGAGSLTAYRRLEDLVKARLIAVLAFADLTRVGRSPDCLRLVQAVLKSGGTIASLSDNILLHAGSAEAQRLMLGMSLVTERKRIGNRSDTP